MGIERRRDRRHPFRIRVVLSGRPKDLVTQTEDVSFNGIFLRTDTPLPERHLVRLQLTLPPGDDQLVVTGMVARCIRSWGGRPPGAGIQFYGLAQQDRERWGQFIQHVASMGAQASSSRSRRSCAGAPRSPSPVLASSS